MFEVVGKWLVLITETEHAAPEISEEGKEGLRPDDALRTMEKKAINFLVNEYLLQINNKLTAVTFSEENEDQVIGLINLELPIQYTCRIILYTIQYKEYHCDNSIYLNLGFNFFVIKCYKIDEHVLCGLDIDN